MTGDWALGRGGERDEPYTRAAIELENGARVSLTDSRALATLVLVDDPETALPRLGPEPGEPGFTAQALAASLARRRGAIKPALLDQRVVAGLGNIYAAESLWTARISPRARAASLSLARLTRLVNAVRSVLRRAPGGRYWVESRRARWKVYDREGEPCPRCGATIRRIVQAGRSTYYCPHCQRV